MGRRRWLYRDWEARLAASGAVVGVELQVDAVLPGCAYVTRLRVPRVVGRHYRVTSLQVGGEEQLGGPVDGAEFAYDSDRPSIMVLARRGTVVSVRVVKVADVPVPFVCSVLGMRRVGRSGEDA